MSSGPFAGIRKFGPLGPGGGVLGPETSGMPVTRPEPWISLSQCSRWAPWRIAVGEKRSGWLGRFPIIILLMGGANRLMGEPGWLCEVRVVGRFDLDRRLSIWSGLRIAPRIMGRAGERNNAREQW